MNDDDKIKNLERKLAESEKNLKIKELEDKIASNENMMTNSSLNNNAYEGLYCSSDDKIVLGLCGGLAHKFNLQSSVVRFGVCLSLFFFIGWFYLVGLFLPKLATK